MMLVWSSGLERMFQYNICFLEGGYSCRIRFVAAHGPGRNAIHQNGSRLRKIRLLARGTKLSP